MAALLGPDKVAGVWRQRELERERERGEDI